MGKGAKNFVIAAVVLVIFAAVGFAAYVVLTGQRTINTGNARVTTNYVTVAASMPGALERFNLYEGMLVEEEQVLGWLQNGETFRSPINGVVVNTSVVEGQNVMPMQPLATIADLANLHIQANLYESDIQDIFLGQPVAITLDGVRGHTFAGYVSNISRITEVELHGGAIVVQTGTFRRITRTIPVEVTITDNIDLSQFLGTNARASFPVISVQNG
jgi:multidrug resistance efflux pump